MLTTLVQHRSKAGVEGPYLFARPHKAKYPYRGNDCLRRYAYKCGAKYPQILTSTRLRKKLAILSQVLNLSENNQDILAAFMGHDIRVHRSFYRLPESTLELAKVTKILHSINNGTIGKYKGKDFE